MSCEEYIVERVRFLEKELVEINSQCDKWYRDYLKVEKDLKYVLGLMSVGYSKSADKSFIELDTVFDNSYSKEKYDNLYSLIEKYVGISNDRD